MYGVRRNARWSDLWETGKAAWPQLAVSLDQLGEFLGSGDNAAGSLRAADVYLACACASGSSDAIAAFEASYGAVLSGVVARFGRDPSHRDELRQLLREHLFVAPPGERPRIAGYSGRGFLENWLRVAATRALINAGRRNEPSAPSPDGDDLEDLPDRARDLELSFLKRQYQEAFRRAFAGALRGLESEQRLLLRLSLLEGLTVDAIGAALGVHRATAARRVARAREQILSRTISALQAELGASAAEIGSLQALIDSHLDLSLSRLLGDGASVRAKGSAQP